VASVIVPSRRKSNYREKVAIGSVSWYRGPLSTLGIYLHSARRFKTPGFWVWPSGGPGFVMKGPGRLLPDGLGGWTRKPM